MKFTNHYSGQTVCSPSRSSLMTGMHMGHSSVKRNGQLLNPDDITVAELLKEAGYKTAAIGKWGLAMGPKAPNSANQQGFDYWFCAAMHKYGRSCSFCPPQMQNLVVRGYKWFQSPEVLFEKLLEKDEYGVYRIEFIHLKYKKEKQEKAFCLRFVYYGTSKGVNTNLS
jgi:arylsulfatase A-like enzyme